MAGDKDRYHHGDLRRALVAAAAGLLEAEGLEALSLRGVAAAAGVSHNAPYRHFADKRALLTAVAALGFADLAVRLGGGQAPGQAPGEVRGEEADAALAARALAYLSFAAERPAMYRLMFASDLVVGSTAPELGASSIGAFESLRAAVAACLPGRTAEAAAGAVASVLWAQLHGLALLLAENRIRPWMREGVSDRAITEAAAQALPGQARLVLAGLSA